MKAKKKAKASLRTETILTKAVTVKRIVLPEPMPHQLPMLLSPARFKVLVCGRRWGKTILGLIAVVGGHGPSNCIRGGAAHGKHVAWIAPNYPMAMYIWKELKKAMWGAWAEKSEETKTITLDNGGSIAIRSADNPDSLRGVSYDGLVLDEAALMYEETWNEALRPTLSDTQGWCIFISTPKWQTRKGIGTNWMRKLYEDAQGRRDWEAWQRPTSDNPLIPTKEIEAARREIGSMAFRQEYLAEFVSPSGIFKRETFRYYRPFAQGYTLDNRTLLREDLQVFCTVDLATSTSQMADFTVVATWGMAKTGELLLLDVMRGRFEGNTHSELMRQAFNKWRPTNIWIEKVGYQQSIIQTLRRPPWSLPVRELIADKDKVTRALPAEAKYEAGLIYHPISASWLDDWEEELMTFPQGAHDDQVDCVSYAVSQVIGRTPRAYFLE